MAENEAELLLTFKAATGELAEAAKALKSMTSASKKAEDATDKMKKSQINWGKALQTTGKAVAGAVVGLSAYAASAGALVYKLAHVDAALKGAKSPFEKYGAAGEKAFAQINEFATKAGLSLEKTREMGGKLATAGFSADNAQKLVKLMADLSAGTADGEKSFAALGDKITEIGAKSTFEWSDFNAMLKNMSDPGKVQDALMSRTGTKNLDQLKKKFQDNKVALDDFLDSARQVSKTGGAGSLGALAIGDGEKDPMKVMEKFSSIFQQSVEKLAANVFTDRNMATFNSLATAFSDFVQSDVFTGAALALGDALRTSAEAMQGLTMALGGKDADQLRLEQQRDERLRKEHAQSVAQLGLDPKTASPGDVISAQFLNALGLGSTDKKKPPIQVTNQVTIQGNPSPETIKQVQDAVTTGTKRAVGRGAG